MKPIPFNALAKLLELHHHDQTLVRGVCIDSRTVQPGDLFFALPGCKTDGHNFIQEAVSKGAMGAIVREDYHDQRLAIPLLRVPNVLAALQDFAQKSLVKRKSKVIAITGSLGKTTTKGFIATLLRTTYRIFASPLSFNSQVTVPLSILLADENEEYLVLEMGMSHEGNLKNLISIAPPHIALLTTVAVQHACNFSDGLEGISREKATIFTHPKTELGILHHDILHYKEILATGSCLKKTFSSTTPEADYFIEVVNKEVRIHVKGEALYAIPLVLPLHVHYQNFLAAVVLARSLEIPWPLIREVAPFLKLPPMRFEKIERGGILFINDAYNANPDSVKAALESLPTPLPGGKVIAVLSEMDALGMYTESGHKQVAEAALKVADYLLCLGSRCETMREIWVRANKPVELFESRTHLESALKRVAKPGDVVLLKGARSYALDQLLDAFGVTDPGD
jgi:UDP-N-acetylmuramoyl-tripeptide--D-alanyl-D-alanine ligase